MDLQSPRYLEARVEGVAEPLKLKGSIRELLPKLMLWLHQTRNGNVTVHLSAQPIQHNVIKLATNDGAPLPPDPTDSDDWDSYFRKLLDFFDGAESMAEFIANEAFERPQHPWIGDEKAARFIHMNASGRLFEKADPVEYAYLEVYVQEAYPELYESLALKG